MCCIFAVLVFLGPRVALILWWIIDRARFDFAFDGVIAPLLGFALIPWTTLMYVALHNPWFEIGGWDYLWLGLALLVDLMQWSGSLRGNRNQLVPSMP